MRNIALIFGIIFLLASSSHAARMESRINNLLKNKCFNGSKISIIVKSLTTGEVYYSLNPDELLIPASNMKIVTSAAALETLKPLYRFKTRLLHTGTRSGETLNGDLVVKGGGDPHLVSEDLWLMANEIRNRGIRVIKGDLLLDDSFFGPERIPPSWEVSNHRRAFEAPTGALSLNFNSFAINIYPSLEETGKAHVSLDPGTPYLKLDNLLQTRAGKPDKITLFFKNSPGEGETVVVGGHMQPRREKKTYYRSVKNPILYFGHTFIRILREAGITLEGNIVHGKTVETATEIFVHESRPLYQQLADMNKFSNNFMAEQLLKTLAAENVANPGSFSNGVKSIEEYLKSVGVSQDRFHIADGSGFSKSNRLSTSVIIEVLERFYREWEFGPEFISSFALMGKDGSVQERLLGTEKTIRVKTGTLNSVSALSGYYPVRPNDILVFSMVFNDLACGNGDILAIQDKLLLEMGNSYE